MFSLLLANMSGGDKISDLPIDKNMELKPTDLEFMHNLFQPKNKEIIENAFYSFKNSILLGILFLILSSPIVFNMINGLANNKLVTYITLFVLFVIMSFIIQKVL